MASGVTATHDHPFGRPRDAKLYEISASESRRMLIGRELFEKWA